MSQTGDRDLQAAAATQAVAEEEEEKGEDLKEEEEEDDDDESLDAFKCTICWDWLYKPVVLPCGHVFCFWCIQQSTDHWSCFSQCAVCRKVYTHGPDVCKLLHAIVLKVCPPHFLSKREHEIRDIEAKRHMFSTPIPQTETCGFQGTGSCASTSASNKAEAQLTYKLEPKDFLCTSCKELIYRPIVLHCGEVFCEHCIRKLGAIACCPSCNTIQPPQSLHVCWSLHQYMLQAFTEVYMKRKTEIPKEYADEITPNIPSAARNEELEDGVLIHINVGCDRCGMFPIVGDRYRCQDCPESAGFDLCGSCYEHNGDMCGRFSQQHIAAHRMEKNPLPPG